MRPRFLLVLLAVACALVGVQQTFASTFPYLMDGPYTHVYPNIDGEPSLLVANDSNTPAIMTYLYGAGKYTRVPDFGTTNDQVWTSLDDVATAVAKFAGDTHTLYWLPVGDSRDEANPIFTNSSSGYNPPMTDNGPEPFAIGHQQFTFELYDNVTKTWFSSDPSKNVGGEDHMVTFQLKDAAGELTDNYVIAWEDLYTYDYDYQDFVVEISGVKGVPALSTPEPATIIVWSLLGALAISVGYWRRKRAA